MGSGCHVCKCAEIRGSFNGTLAPNMRYIVHRNINDNNKCFYVWNENWDLLREQLREDGRESNITSQGGILVEVILELRSEGSVGDYLYKHARQKAK